MKKTDSVEQATHDTEQELSSLLMHARFRCQENQPRLQEAYWRDYICAEISPIDVHRLEGQPISGAADVKLLSNELLISEFDYGTQRLHRTRKHYEAADEGYFILGMGLTGWGRLQIGNTIVTPQAGDLVFYYLQNEVEVALKQVHDVLIRIPERFVFQIIPDAKDLSIQCFSRHSASAQIVGQIMRSLAFQSADMPATESVYLRNALMQSIGACFASTGQGAVQSNLERYHYQKAINFLRNHYDVADLNVQQIALACGISTAYLHQLFAEQDTAPMRALWKIRLEQANRYLQLAIYSKLQVAEIGYRCGFTSPAHFSRLFKQQFGITPTQARKESTKPAQHE